MIINLPDKLAKELDKIDWQKIKEAEINLLIAFGLPYLKQKGYLKTEKETENEHIKKNTQ